MALMVAVTATVVVSPAPVSSAAGFPPPAPACSTRVQALPPSMASTSAEAKLPPGLFSAFELRGGEGSPVGLALSLEPHSDECGGRRLLDGLLL